MKKRKGVEKGSKARVLVDEESMARQSAEWLLLCMSTNLEHSHSKSDSSALFMACRVVDDEFGEDHIVQATALRTQQCYTT